MFMWMWGALGAGGLEVLCAVIFLAPGWAGVLQLKCWFHISLYLWIRSGGSGAGLIVLGEKRISAKERVPGQDYLKLPCCAGITPLNTSENQVTRTFWRRSCLWI